jgi:Zn ribbon nucleic-acid-binding protein
MKPACGMQDEQNLYEMPNTSWQECVKYGAF